MKFTVYDFPQYGFSFNDWLRSTKYRGTKKSRLLKKHVKKYYMSQRYFGCMLKATYEGVGFRGFVYMDNPLLRLL